MKHLLLDQGLPQSAVQHLGNGATHVSMIGMSNSSDQAILEHAEAEDSIVITLDSDFHTILAINQAVRPSVIRIRIEGLKGQEVAKLIQQVVSTTANDIESGAAVTVTERGIRVRKLPLA